MLGMTSGADWLIAGLGNPEPKYDGTRHNTGFAALDALADKWNISVGKTKFQGLWGQGEVDGHKVVLLKQRVLRQGPPMLVLSSPEFRAQFPAYSGRGGELK